MSSGTFTYAPDIRVLVATSNGVLDLSDDIESFTVNRRTSAMSDASIILNNKYGKYDQRIERMSRAVVFLKRLNWLQVLAGYVHKTPFLSLMPRSVEIGIKCTLKRAEHTFWDPYTVSSQSLLPGVIGSGAEFGQITEDGGTAQSIFRILTKVVGWDPNQLHIQKIPGEFIQYASNLYTKNVESIDQNAVNWLNDLLDGGGIVNGSPVGSAGSDGVSSSSSYPLPYNRAQVSIWAGGVGPQTGDMIITGESRKSPRDDWYAALPLSNNVTEEARAYWKNRRVLLRNENDPNRGVVVRPADITATQGRVGISYRAMTSALVLGQNDWVTVQQVADSTPLGVWTSSDPIRRFQDPVSATSSSIQAQSAVSSASSIGPNDASFVSEALRHQGDQYVWGGGRVFSDPDPSGFDCSGLVVYALNRIGIRFAGTATTQYEACKAAGTLIPITQAINTRGALLFKFGGTGWGKHVAISLGNGQTIEALPQTTQTQDVDGVRKTGVNTYNANNRGWTHAGLVPGLTYNGSIPLGVSGSSAPGASGVNSPFNIIFKNPTITMEAETFTQSSGRAWLNDEKVLLTLQSLCKASLREFQSAPNGDFIAWFPDYWGLWGKTPTMKIRDIEIQDFTIDVDDSPLVTHVGVAGDTTTLGTSVSLPDWLQTAGLVTLEDEAVLRLLLGTDVGSTLKSDVKGFLHRFGLRPRREAVPNLRLHEWELMYALQVFMESWVAQYNTPIQLTFMPELYPGMRIHLVDHDIELYVQGVRHSGSRSSGFNTTVTVTAPKQDGKILGLETALNESGYPVYTANFLRLARNLVNAISSRG